jgi:hypothetical protein
MMHADRPEIVTVNHRTYTGRRRTGGERPATSQQQATRNDTRRQGQRRYRSIATGHEMAMLAFTRQRPQGLAWKEPAGWPAASAATARSCDRRLRVS